MTRYKYLFFFFLLGLVFPAKVFGQSLPINCSSLPGWKADISLRGSAWHHQGTLVNQATQVAVGFLAPDGNWVAADKVTFGDAGFIPTNGNLYFDHTWSSPGSYTISLLKQNCRFNRKIWVAASSVNVSQVILTQNNQSYQNQPVGYKICGTVADYQQFVGPSPLGTMSFSMPPLQNFNNYRGVVGGLEPLAMPTSLASGQTKTSNRFSVNYQVSDYGPAVQTETARWQINPSPLGVAGGWVINNLKIYLDCFLDHGAVPNPSPSPTPTVIPVFTPYACSTVYGYVKNPNVGGSAGLAGAVVEVHGINNSAGKCSGGHVGCGFATTNWQGYWKITCKDNIPINCLGVYETKNAANYVDSAKLPTGPAGSSFWSVNQIMLNNPTGSSCGPFTFYDKP